jgi:hypothetical protein
VEAGEEDMEEEALEGAQVARLEEESAELRVEVPLEGLVRQGEDLPRPTAASRDCSSRSFSTSSASSR